MHPQKGTAALADLAVTTSSEALLSGKAPTFRLLIWAVNPDNEPVPGVMYVVSESFVVSHHLTNQQLPSGTKVSQQTKSDTYFRNQTTGAWVCGVRQGRSCVVTCVKLRRNVSRTVLHEPTVSRNAQCMAEPLETWVNPDSHCLGSLMRNKMRSSMVIVRWVFRPILHSLSGFGHSNGSKV